MSKKNTTGAEFDQDTADTATIDQTETPAVEPVVRAEQYVFADYEVGRSFKDPMAIDDLFVPGFNPEPYHFAWIRFNKLDTAKGRYFTKVTPMVHAKWFKPTAFNNVHKAIVCGQEYLNGEVPEFYLHVRLKDADVAEKKAQAELGKHLRKPEESDQFKQVTSGIAGRVGANNVIGSGLTRSVGGWK